MSLPARYLQPLRDPAGSKVSSLCSADLAQHHQCAWPCPPSAQPLLQAVSPELLAWKQKLSVNLMHGKMIPGWEKKIKVMAQTRENTASLCFLPLHL